MRFNSKAGQSLLIIVLLIAVVFTIIASASYRLTTETQSARIQEDTVRTLAAADSGIEKGLQLLSEDEDGPFRFVDVGLTLNGIDATQSTIDIATSDTTAFTSPIVQKDEQYTFYLTDYPDYSTFYRNQLYVYYGPSDSSPCTSPRSNIPTLEITLIYGNNLVHRWISEPCPATSPSVEYDNSNLTPSTVNTTVDGQQFRRRITIPLNQAQYNNEPKLLIVRPLFADTRIGFQATGAANFTTQGRTITAEAVSTTGISKIVTLFRSNPQIPADFFVTTF